MLNKLLSPVGSIILIICIGLATSYFISHHPTVQESNDGGESTQAFFAATFLDANAKPQALKQWQGKIIVLNFWATWCQPCREEMPELSELNTQYKDKNVIVLGLAIDDVKMIQDFIKETKISYPLLAAEEGGMDLASSFGNNKSVLPYTVIIKPDGGIAKTYFGRISKQQLEAALIKLF